MVTAPLHVVGAFVFVAAQNKTNKHKKSNVFRNIYFLGVMLKLGFHRQRVLTRSRCLFTHRKERRGGAITETVISD